MMNKQELIRLFAVATAALAGLSLSASIASAQAISSDGFPGSVPKAICGPTDHTESGLQGETTQQERFGGDSETAYNCNLELVGQEPQDAYLGAYSQDGPAYYDVCAYYGTDHGPTTGQGIKVIDASDPRHPQVTANLTDSPAALNPHETVATNANTRLLVAGQNGGPNFAVYDISDCRHPVLKSSINLPGSNGHMGAFASDGKTYYLSQNPCCSGFGGPIYIVDLSDPSDAKQLPTWDFLGDGRPHSLDLNPQGFAPGLAEGTRAYMGQGRSWPFADARDGLVITDVSDYQFRRPNPQIRIISTLFYPDQGTGESMIPVKIKGHPYIISVDEAGAAGGSDGWAGACARGAPAFGYPQIIDVADETSPKIIAKLRLQVSDPANCAALLAETPPDVPGTAPGTNLPAISGTTNYSGESCVADNPAHTKMLACGFQNAGLRVFDVSHPTHPKEIAYWKPGAVRTTVLPASGSWATGVDRTVDKIAHWPRWVVVGKGNDDGNGVGGGNGNSADIQLWTVSDGHGFQVLQFTKSFTAQHKDLFENTVTSRQSR
jgi:LVIVD repeat-containing protein